MDIHADKFSTGGAYIAAATSVKRAAVEGESSRISGVWKRASSSPESRSSGFLNRPRSSEQLPIPGMRKDVKAQDTKGEAILVEHQYQGKKVGEESATRVHGQQKFKEAIQGQRRYLLETDRAGNEKKIARLQKMSENSYQDVVVRVRRFFDSNYHRSFMKEACRAVEGPVTAAKYREIADSTNCGLIHARNMNLKVEKDEHGLPREYGLMRLGVMSDLRNGATNLRELKECEGNEGLKQAKLNELKAAQQKYKEGTPSFAALKVAIEDIQNPKEALEARQERMELLMLQYLAAQAERDPSKLEGDTWNVVDVRLLDPSKNEVDSDSGWVHNETNQLLDMKEIFSQFSGKTVVLDGKGPYIDKEGKVHLPIDRGGKELDLKARLINISVQGQMENGKVQQSCNSDDLQALSDDPAIGNQEDWQEMVALLQDGKSNATVAEKAVFALVKAGYSVSVGCLSAKDRTGWVVGRVMAKLMSEGFPDLRKALTKQLLSAKSMASQILSDVTGWRFMKLDFRTMGSDVTIPMKLKHAAGLTAEWSAKCIKKEVAALKDVAIDQFRERFFSVLTQ